MSEYTETYGAQPTCQHSHATLLSQNAKLREALRELVRINEEHNEAVSKIIAKPLGWKDTYLDNARAALAEPQL